MVGLFLHHLGAFPTPTRGGLICFDIFACLVRARWYYHRRPVFAADGKPGTGRRIRHSRNGAPIKMEDGSVAGPFHHYCKGHQAGVLQCLLF